MAIYTPSPSVIDVPTVIPSVVPSPLPSPVPSMEGLISQTNDLFVLPNSKTYVNIVKFKAKPGYHYSKIPIANLNFPGGENYIVTTISELKNKHGRVVEKVFEIYYNSNRFDVFDSADNTWRTDKIELGGSISDNRMASIKPCFTIAEGAIRMSPGNFTSVDSGGDLISGATGDFVADTNPGGFELVVTDAGFDADIAPGDTIIIGKTAADAPGQEMVALITADQALTAARNMTGSFPSSLDVTTSNDDVYVMPDTRWRGVVKRKNFAQAGIRGTFIEWYSSYAHPRPPVTWDATNDLGQQVGAGVYLYQLQTKNFVKTRKMVLLK